MRQIALVCLAALLLSGCGTRLGDLAEKRAAAPTDGRVLEEAVPPGGETDAGQISSWQGETRSDGRRCEGYRNLEAETVEVRILDGETIFQTVSLADPGWSGLAGEAHWEDADFDGDLDVLVFLGGGRGGTCFYAALLWDEASGEYREALTYADIPRPAPDPKHRLVWGGYDVSYGYRVSAWEVRDGAFVETHVLETSYLEPAAWGQGIRYTEYARSGAGELEAVNWLDVPEQGAYWDHPEEYLSAPPVWEGWAWCEFQRFRQMG